jgi:glycosyltransferase involved in cell wall biosynthesis
MKKILYITTVDISSDSGVRKKIYGQIRVMRESGLEVALIAPSGDDIVVVEGGQDEEERMGVVDSYMNVGPLRFFDLTRSLYKSAYELAHKDGYDGVFIRYSLAERGLIRMLRKLKEEGVKTFIEIPSYPYDLEYENKQWYKKFGLYLDKIYRKKLKDSVDIIFTPGPQQESIYGVNAVSFNNGVNTEDIEERKYSGKKEGVLRFIGVANLNSWHGYDRVIKGIAEYYKDKDDIDFVFNIVGEGIELNNLKDLVKELELQDRVIFHGFKSGKELDQVYNNSDIAISSVGLYRLGVAPRLVLKAREACLKGIPFVAVKGDPVFDNDFDYVYFVKDEGSPLQVEKIYNWFVDLDAEEYLDEMNKFAKEHLDWRETFKDPISVMKKVMEE